DMYEHAYHMDFGADAKAYIAAFMDNVEWGGVSLRHSAAVEASTLALAANAEDVQRPSDARRIDVRRKAAYDAEPDLIEGAVWRDPVRVDDWAREFSGSAVVVYCVRGYAISQSTAARL